MALTDQFLALAFAQIAIYFVLYNAKVRWKRIIGSAGIVLIGFSYVLIADDLVMMIAMFMSLMIGGIKLFEEVAAMAN